MSDVDDKDKIRKTVSVTHRQLGVGAGLVAAVLGIGKLTDFKNFITSEQAAAIIDIRDQQNKGFDRVERAQVEIKQMLKDMDAENLVRFRRSRDISSKEISDAEDRATKNTDRVEKRVENLEIFAFKSKPRSSSNN